MHDIQNNLHDYKHTENKNTYNFLDLQTILEENHEWGDAILTEVKHAQHAQGVHWITCEKLMRNS